MTTGWRRLSSNEVGKISVANQDFSILDTDFFAEFTDPTFPNGTEVRDVSGDQPGPLRVLGLAKIFEPIGPNGNVRNATAPEIATFAPAEDDDTNIQDAVRALELLSTHSNFGKLFKALVRSIVDKDNLMATEWNAFRAEAALAANLNNLQQRIANNTSDVPIQVFTDTFDAMGTDIDKDD